MFPQKLDPSLPKWDSGACDALHQAAEAKSRDLPGLGLHSFRRANITWQQEVGDSAIEVSKIASHSDLEMTGEHTFVAPERQNELTRQIQYGLARPPESETSPVLLLLADFFTADHSHQDASFQNLSLRDLHDVR